MSRLFEVLFKETTFHLMRRKSSKLRGSHNDWLTSPLILKTSDVVSHI